MMSQTDCLAGAYAHLAVENWKHIKGEIINIILSIIVLLIANTVLKVHYT